MTVYAYEYTCDVCGEKKCTMTDFKNWNPPKEVRCETLGCFGSAKLSSYTGPSGGVITDGLHKG